MSIVDNCKSTATAICVNCGRACCPDCGAEINGRIHCKDCVTGSGMGMGRHDYRSRESYQKQKSGFLLFLTSMIPGVGLMYLGLIKRGLFFLTSFFVLSYLSSWGFGGLGIFIPILFITSIFDGFKKLRLMNDGITVDDDIKDIVGFAVKYKKYLLILLALLVLNWAVGILTSVLSFVMPFGLGTYHTKRIISLALIVGGILFLVKKK